MRAFGLFHTDYYVLELDDDYEWGARGPQHPAAAPPSSRGSPRMRRETLRHIVGLAERRGYPLDRLRLLRAPQ